MPPVLFLDERIIRGDMLWRGPHRFIKKPFCMMLNKMDYEDIKI